ncbi:MAG: glycosyltransferase [Anaerolineales bacterium]|nr:glycosyltransferase [Anaerolineales bacterium]MCB0012575.1 glycosyltransferase [Anaerolineales bacterium]MCB8962159.1 glycosyltransferase [Ardenticatenales bacterium]
MKISIIVPVLNDLRVEHLLRSLTNQSLPKEEYEILVVDNSGNDKIKQIVARFQTQYLVETRPGSYNARNAGIAAASGEFLAFIDADCIADPDWLKELMIPFQDLQTGGVGGSIVKNAPKSWIEQGTRNLAEGQNGLQHIPFSPWPFIVTGNAAYRASIIRSLGGFDGTFTSGGDADMSWRVLHAGYDITIAPKAVIYHASRSSLADYFRQHAKYTTGQALLFKKYAAQLNRRWYFHAYPIKGYLRIARDLGPTLIQFLRNQEKGRSEASRLLLEFVMYSGMLCGALRGALKHKVAYI